MAIHIVQQLVEELRQETESTRSLLDLLPQERLSWKPHARSMSLGQLALHIAGLPGGLAVMLNAPAGEVPVEPLPEASSVAEVLALLDEQSAAAERIIASWNDEALEEPYSWTVQGTPVAVSTRYSQVRSVLFNHWYHHRGQLTVYLRLLDVKIPGIYGPSADEA